MSHLLLLTHCPLQSYQLQHRQGRYGPGFRLGVLFCKQQQLCTSYDPAAVTGSMPVQFFVSQEAAALLVCSVGQAYSIAAVSCSSDL